MAPVRGSRLVVGICACNLLPALVILAMSVLLAVDSSNDRHRDFSDARRGLLHGLPIAGLTWITFTGLMLAFVLPDLRKGR